MFVWSVKASSLKFIAVLAACCAAIGALAVFLPKYEPDVKVSSKSEDQISYKIKSEDDIKSFLNKFGWDAAEQLDYAEVTIPGEFDKVYESYNVLQKKQGLDLSKYKNKTVTRYTYKITNYPDYNGTVLADIIVYKNKIIGGDICSADVNGFLHGFSSDVTLP